MRAGVSETLQEVADAVAAGESFALALGNFMAFMKPEQVSGAICDPPAILAGRHPHGIVSDAYLAAVGEMLAIRVGITPPSWTEDPARFLNEFHYPGQNRRLNELLLQETPEPFRRRRIVVSANALDVA